jgi:hypothetical protein
MNVVGLGASVRECERCQFLVLTWRDGQRRDLRDGTGNTANTYVLRALVRVSVEW